MSAGMLVNSNGAIFAMAGGAVGTDNVSECDCCEVRCQCNVSGVTYNVSGWNVTTIGLISPVPSVVPSADLNGTFFIPATSTGSCGGSKDFYTGGSGESGLYGFNISLGGGATSINLDGVGGGGGAEVALVFTFLCATAYSASYGDSGASFPAGSPSASISVTPVF